MTSAQPPASTAPSLGAMLRRARESASMTQAELARQLNLGAHVVEAMEQEDLQAMPSAVYVHGYLRKWAAFLHLDERQLQRAYAQLAGEQGQGGMRHITPIEPMRLKKPQSSFPWGKLIILLGIVALGFFAARFFPESLRIVSGTLEPAPESSLQLALEPDAALPSIPLPPPAAPPRPAPPALATTQGIVVGEPVAGAVEPGAKTQPTDMPTETHKPVSPQGLTLSGQGSAQGSWVRVKDVQGEVIFEGMIPPGQIKTLDGVRPFEITLGRASDIKVELDGQNVDLSAYSRPGGKAFIPKLGATTDQ